LQKYVQPSQKNVTNILTYMAQASHSLVDPSVLVPCIKTLANNFVTDRSSEEVMAVGINAIREICSRAPLCMDKELLNDLTQYKKSKFKGVMMASRSLISLFREVNPQLLTKKDRGRDASESVLQNQNLSLEYGQVIVNTDVKDADLFLQHDPQNDQQLLKNYHLSDDDDDLDMLIARHMDDDDDDDNDHNADVDQKVEKKEEKGKGEGEGEEEEVGEVGDGEGSEFGSEIDEIDENSSDTNDDINNQNNVKSEEGKKENKTPKKQKSKGEEGEEGEEEGELVEEKEEKKEKEKKEEKKTSFGGPKDMG